MPAPTPDAVIVGVDTPKDAHVAVAVTGPGARLGAISTPATATGDRQLAHRAHAQGPVLAFGIKGTGSYGAGLSRALTAQGCRVIEVTRPHRQLRRQRGRSDTIEAEAAARAVLAGAATAPPQPGNREVEMIRPLKVARDTALKARTQAMVPLRTLPVNAPQPRRERLIAITGPRTLVRALAARRPGPRTSPTASARTVLRALARRWLALDAEIREQTAPSRPWSATKRQPGWQRPASRRSQSPRGSSCSATTPGASDRRPPLPSSVVSVQSPPQAAKRPATA